MKRMGACSTRRRNQSSAPAITPAWEPWRAFFFSKKQKLWSFCQKERRHDISARDRAAAVATVDPRGTRRTAWLVLANTSPSIAAPEP